MLIVRKTAMHKISRKELKCATVTIKKEGQVYGILEKSKMELASASITADNDSKVCPMNKNIRIEALKCAIMTFESDRQICEMHEYSRMELGCTIMTVERVSKICRIHKNRRIEPQFAKMTVENALKV